MARDEEAARYRLGADVGGTHTDLVLLDTENGELLIEKVASTPDNPAHGVLNGIARFIGRGIAASEIGFFAHGTTITTNALLEMRGAKVGLLISKGFRAVQEVQNQAREGNLFDYFYSKPAPIVPQSLTREIPERCDCDGNVLVPIDEDAVRSAVRELNARGVESIAVCYLFSFMNPAHEHRTRALIRQECPELYVSLSSEILPRIREWSRLSTTLINAYLEPVMVRYISDLSVGLDRAGLRTRRRFLMQSNGGVMPFSAAIAGSRTAHTLLSGPAAGAQASAFLARDNARSGLVTLDMGGTSADIAFIEGGAPLEMTEAVIARRQVDVPALDMTTISASVISSGAPPSMNAISALVPPMSSVTRPDRASSRPRKALACAPAAGPESSVCTVRLPAIAAENGMTPPFDCIRKRRRVLSPALSRPALRSLI